MKKVVSIVLLSVFLMHLAGFYAYFVVRQSQIRQEMKEAIGSFPAAEFVTFELTEEEYKQVRVNDHEVKVDSRMYDHSSLQFEKGKIILHARHDTAEDNLISFLKDVVSASLPDDKPIPSQLINFFSLIFVSHSPFSIAAFFISEKIFFQYAEKLLSEHLPVKSPPPRFC